VLKFNRDTNHSFLILLMVRGSPKGTWLTPKDIFHINIDYYPFVTVGVLLALRTVPQIKTRGCPWFFPCTIIFVNYVITIPFLYKVHLICSGSFNCIPDIMANWFKSHGFPIYDDTHRISTTHWFISRGFMGKACRLYLRSYFGASRKLLWSERKCFFFLFCESVLWIIKWWILWVIQCSQKSWFI